MKVFDCHVLFGREPGGGPVWELSELLRLLDAHGVARALVHNLRGIYDDFCAANDELLEACRTDPRLVPAAIIDPRRYIDCVEEVDRMADAGVRAFRFFPHIQGWPVEGFSFRRVAEKIASVGGAIFLPAQRAEEAAAAVRAAGDLGCPIVLYGWGYAPFGEILAAMHVCPNIFAETYMINSPWAFELLFEEGFGDRLLFSSELPRRYFSSAWLMLERSELSDEQRQLVAWSNAARILLGEGVA